MRPSAISIRNAIEQDIATGDASPGARLDECSLAERFGVSRTPVREALGQLAASGMIELRPHRGAVVADVTPDRLFQMFEAMAELEAAAAGLAARRMQPADARALQAAQEACRKARLNPDAYYEANEQFHQLIYHASGNPVLAEQCLALQKRLRPYRRLQLRVAGRTNRSFDEHASVLAALEAGDGARAAEALRAHVMVQGERFADLVAGLARLKAVA
jgi:DNA-binding GntR family transcriptional regulator